MPAGSAHLPDALVGLAPALLQDLEQQQGQRPRVRARRRARARGLPQHVEQLAVHVELQLRVRAVAGAYRSRALVAGEPVELELREPALAADAVHRLQLLGVTGRGAEQPLAPAQRLGLVAADQERLERQRRVAHPAVAVVPVPGAADRLGQRSGRRGDDAAGRLGGQRLQREQRPQHRLAPFTGVGAARRPVRPVPVVCSTSAAASSGTGRGSFDGNQPSTNGTCSPAATVNSAADVCPVPVEMHRRVAARDPRGRRSRATGRRHGAPTGRSSRSRSARRARRAMST